MLLMTRQYFPFIQFDNFKKLLVNLHKHSRRSDIKLSQFKDTVVHLIGYENFAHFKNAVEKSKTEPLYLKYGKKYSMEGNCGEYLLYPLSNQIRKLLEIPFDLYFDVLEKQIMRFTTKKPYLIIDGGVYSDEAFSKAITAAKSRTKKLAVLCMAHNKTDALAIFWSTKIETNFQHPMSFYDDSDIDEVRFLGLSHLQPKGASLPYTNHNIELQQLKRPDIAMKYWANINNHTPLQKLLSIAEDDISFRTRCYIDEYTANFSLSNAINIKAERLYTIEFSTREGTFMGPLHTFYKDFLNKSIEMETLTIEDIIKRVYEARAELQKNYGKDNFSLYIISNGILFFEQLAPELTVPLEEVFRTKMSPDHFDIIIKIFGLNHTDIKNMVRF